MISPDHELVAPIRASQLDIRIVDFAGSPQSHRRLQSVATDGVISPQCNKAWKLLWSIQKVSAEPQFIEWFKPAWLLRWIAAILLVGRRLPKVILFNWQDIVCESAASTRSPRYTEGFESLARNLAKKMSLVVMTPAELAHLPKTPDDIRCYFTPNFVDLPGLEGEELALFKAQTIANASERFHVAGSDIILVTRDTRDLDYFAPKGIRLIGFSQDPDTYQRLKTAGYTRIIYATWPEPMLFLAWLFIPGLARIFGIKRPSNQRPRFPEHPVHVPTHCATQTARNG